MSGEKSHASYTGLPLRPPGSQESRVQGLNKSLIHCTGLPCKRNFTQRFDNSMSSFLSEETCKVIKRVKAVKVYL